MILEQSLAKLYLHLCRTPDDESPLSLGTGPLTPQKMSDCLTLQFSVYYEVTSFLTMAGLLQQCMISRLTVGL